METTTEEQEHEPLIRTLTYTDRCDSCGSQAYMAVTFLTGELLFCGHHSKKFAGTISEQAVGIHDQTSDLSTKRQGL
jgi:hypothetical protein